MTDKDLQSLRKRIEALGQDIHKRRAEFERVGVFANIQAGTWKNIEAAHTHITGRLDKLSARPGVWAEIRYELIRDFEALCDDFRRLMDRLDAEENVRMHQRATTDPVTRRS